MPAAKRALIAMSGGVDSSVAAHLAKKSGMDCIGVTMKLFYSDTIVDSRRRTCCTLEDAEDARSVAYRIGIPHYVFNFTDDFSQQVIRRFVTAYECGLTPNPCIACNRYIKFKRLYDRAKELGCDYVVTGHYARIETQSGRYFLKKALDKSKDQSYVLYAMTQEQLAHTLFPCGSISKVQIREIAKKQGFYNADKPDSQDICFVPDGDYARFIEHYTGQTYPCGAFVLEDGTPIAQHKGIIHYTIGQRKGLGVSWHVPLYVREIDTKSNQIVLSEGTALLQHVLHAIDVNWIAFDSPPKVFRAEAKIRYRQEAQWATVEATGSDTMQLTFDVPQRAITKGQAVVLYDGDTVLGGGTIF